MATTIMSFGDLYGFLDSQISRIRRYREEKEKFTLMFLKSDVENFNIVRNILQENLRQSDILFPHDNYFFIYLSNTDRMGALHIEEMIKEFFSRELAFSYVTYPEDGETKEELFTTLNEICEDELEIELDSYLV